MVKSQKQQGQQNERSKQKGGIGFENAAWEGKSREELTQALCDMIESAPREVAVNWLQTCLLPMLEENTGRRNETICVINHKRKDGDAYYQNESSKSKHS